MSSTFLEKFHFFCQNSDILSMEGWTVPELMTELGLDEGAVKMRLSRAGIEPLTNRSVYPKSALEAIRNVPPRGQHKKKPEPKEDGENG